MVENSIAAPRKFSGLTGVTDDSYTFVAAQAYLASRWFTLLAKKLTATLTEFVAVPYQYF